MKKIPKSTWLPILLLIYLIGMTIYFGIDKIRKGETIEFTIILIAELIIIAILHIFLKKMEQQKKN